MSSRVFRRPDGARIKLDAGALGRLLLHAGGCGDEAGGILLGRYIRGAPHVVVDEVTEPIASDRRGRFRFFRSRAHQSRIDAAWRASDGTCVYLGEWHSHPEPDPTPSATDLKDWRRRLSKDRHDAEAIYFVIVGTQNIRVWQGHRSSGAVSPCMEE